MTEATTQTPDRATRRGSFHARRPGHRLAAPVIGAALVLAAALATTPALSSEAEPAATYPVTVVDSEGTAVEIPAPPERVISLSPAITETAFAIGAGELVVGGTDWDDFPPEAADLADVATFTGVIMERVVDLDPDLVIAAGNEFTPSRDIARMRELGYPVMVVYAETVDEVLADIERIGHAVGRPQEARALTAAMRADLDAVTAAAAAMPTRPRTLYQIGSEPEVYAPAPGSFLADMVELAGGEAITTGDPVAFSIALERIVEADPEVIVLGDAAYGVCPPDVAARPGWSGITAVREGALRPVEDVPVTRPGPRLAQGLASLARAIHPDIELPGFPPDPPIC
jgi:iron complex transport system substrate-binding protein